MKTKFISFIFASAFLLSTFSACDLVTNGGEDQQPIDHFLVSFEKEKSYLPAFIKSILGQFAGNMPEFEAIIEKVEHDITIYSITYLTEFEGEDVIASGLVCVPTNSEEEFPVLSYQNGTNTLHSNAPSVNPDYQLYLLIEFIASTGFITTIPDYLGFGSTDNMFHPYLHKESTVNAVLDMQRATRELVENHLEVQMNNDLYITGYSQGGWATLQVQKEIEQFHSTEFNLKASACGAGSYNLSYVNDYILGESIYPMPYFIGYLFNSYVNLGLEVDPADIFQAPYDTKIMELYDGTLAGPQISEELTNNVSDLFTAEYINGYKTDDKFAPLLPMLRDNSISAWETTTPTLLIHGTADTFVPPMVTSQLFQGFLMQGMGVDDVVMLPLPGEDHQSGIVPAGIASIKWIMDIKDAAEM